MYLPPRTYAIRRMPRMVAQAWAARHCEWCEQKPTCTVHYWFVARNRKSCKLACESHAREASEQTGLRLEE